jgi:hypothetical protein
LLITTVAVTNWTCSKPYYEALPVVQFVSAVPYGNDSLLVTGNISSQGLSAVQYAGFASAEQPSFDIMENQVVKSAGSVGHFTALIKAIQDSTYYIKCFAVNSYGYTATGNYVYTVPAAGPQTAPCAKSITANTVNDAGMTYNITDGYYITAAPTYGKVDIEADNGGTEEIDIYFTTTPINGIYTTSDATNLDFDTNPFDCGIIINNTYLVNSGCKVYIALNNTAGTVTVTYCSLPYLVSSSTYYISGNYTISN